jgi:hypothetical protein
MYAPDSAEAVALELFKIIKESEPKDTHRSNVPEAARLLDLYAQCLAATDGQRAMPASALLH